MLQYETPPHAPLFTSTLSGGDARSSVCRGAAAAARHGRARRGRSGQRGRPRAADGRKHVELAALHERRQRREHPGVCGCPGGRGLAQRGTPRLSSMTAGPCRRATRRLASSAPIPRHFRRAWGRSQTMSWVEPEFRHVLRQGHQNLRRSPRIGRRETLEQNYFTKDVGIDLLV